MVRAPNFSPGQPGYRVSGATPPPVNDEHEHTRSHLVGLLRLKNTVFILILLTGLFWLLEYGASLSADAGLWLLLHASLFIQALGSILFGAIIQRPKVAAFGVFSAFLCLFFLPYLELSTWLGYLGIFATLGLSLLVVGNTDTLPRKKDHAFFRFFFWIGIYVMSFLILWNVTALMSSTIYRIRQTDTAQLSAQMNELLIGTFDPVEVESGVNLSGRFFFADLGPSQGIKVFDRSGKPFTMSKDSSTCLRPYAYVPSADGRSNWLCRVMNTRWIFFYDYRSSFGE